jgi:hypothetical protein
MSSPRDLELERLGDGRRPAHPGETARVALARTEVSLTRDYLAAYLALNDAAFTAHGAAEWLAGLRRAVDALLARKGKSPPPAPVAIPGAIRTADLPGGSS